MLVVLVVRISGSEHVLVSEANLDARTHLRMQACTHTRTHAHAHTHTLTGLPLWMPAGLTLLS